MTYTPTRNRRHRERQHSHAHARARSQPRDKDTDRDTDTDTDTDADTDTERDSYRGVGESTHPLRVLHQTAQPVVGLCGQREAAAVPGVLKHRMVALPQRHVHVAAVTWHTDTRTHRHTDTQTHRHTDTRTVR
eukprot:COSAG03_NODE_1253_length_4469_cov_4.639130_6_plen_133_part_00